jgi:hypothetical protein
VRRLLEEGEAEEANKGGVRGEGTMGQLLAMARETGSGPVRRDRGTEDGGAQLACPREEDEGGALTSVREERGRPGGLAVGHWAGWPVGRRGGGGRWAAAGSKIRNGPKFQKKNFSNFN